MPAQTVGLTGVLLGISSTESLQDRTSAPTSAMEKSPDHDRGSKAGGAMVKRMLREPLLHFFLLGVLLFIVYGISDRRAESPPDQIIVDQPRSERLSREFQELWQRPPTQTELQALVDSWVREEILYREGLAARLDRDDPVIRRRVIQKVHFLSESVSAEVPTDDELQAWLDQHPAEYRIGTTYTLRQVYINPKRHGHDLDTVLQQTMSSLKNGSDLRIGEATMLPATLKGASTSAIERNFGDEFMTAIATLPVGEWGGPVKSGYGLHFVRVDERKDARNATLDEVRFTVERDFMSARTAQALESSFNSMRSRYTVVMEGVPGSTGSGPAVEPSSSLVSDTESPAS